MGEAPTVLRVFTFPGDDGDTIEFLRLNVFCFMGDDVRIAEASRDLPGEVNFFLPLRLVSFIVFLGVMVADSAS